MDPVQKVALIIHEAFYSLVKVECTDLKCRQNSISAQSLTGFVFDETSYVCPVYKGDCLGSVREQLLDIDWRASSFTGPQMIYMKYVDKNGRLSKSLDISLYDSDLAEIRNVNYAPVSKVLCRSIVRNGLQSIAGFNFMLVMDRSSYIVNSKLYRSDSEQTAIKILFRRPRCGYQAGVLSEKKCVEELNKIFSRWYDKSSIDTSVDCLH
jgi:hypothetical protein